MQRTTVPSTEIRNVIVAAILTRGENSVSKIEHVGPIETTHPLAIGDSNDHGVHDKRKQVLLN